MNAPLWIPKWGSLLSKSILFACNILMKFSTVLRLAHLVVRQTNDVPTFILNNSIINFHKRLPNTIEYSRWVPFEYSLHVRYHILKISQISAILDCRTICFFNERWAIIMLINDLLCMCSNDKILMSLILNKAVVIIYNSCRIETLNINEINLGSFDQENHWSMYTRSRCLAFCIIHGVHLRQLFNNLSSVLACMSYR